MNTATLDFPPIEATPRTAVATAAATAVDLTKIDLADVALAQFGDWRTTVTQTSERLRDVAWDLKTPKGFADIKDQRNKLTKIPAADANKTADALVSKLTAVSKRVRTEQAVIVEAYKTLGAPLTALIDARQAELDEEARKAEEARAAAAAVEAARKAAHEAKIATIRAYLTRCQEPGMTSLRVANGIQHLQAQTFGPEWEEYAVPAANAQCETLEAMRQLQAQLLGREQEAARQEAIRLENERVAAELAQERARIEAEAAEIRRRAAALDEEERVRRMQAEAAKMPDLPTERVGEIMRSFAEPKDASLPRVTVEFDLKVQAEPAAAETPQPPPLAELPATMTVTRINELLAPVSITGIGLQKLGFQLQQRPGPEKHFLGSDWELIKAAIVKHVQGRA